MLCVLHEATLERLQAYKQQGEQGRNRKGAASNGPAAGASGRGVDERLADALAQLSQDVQSLEGCDARWVQAIVFCCVMGGRAGSRAAALPCSFSNHVGIAVV